MTTLHPNVTSTLDPYGGAHAAPLEDHMFADSIALNIESAFKTFGGASAFSLAPRSANHAKTIAVNRVSFQVKRGEIFGVLGPNGSGKSTLIRLMATLLIPDGGSISVFGHDVAKEPMAVQRLINRVSVEASFFKKLSPMENLLYGARLYGVERRRSPAAGRGDSHAAGAARKSDLPARWKRCRAACSKKWRLPARSSPRRSCCCSTSRPPASIRAPSARCRPLCANCAIRTTRRSC